MTKTIPAAHVLVIDVIRKATRAACVGSCSVVERGDLRSVKVRPLGLNSACFRAFK